MKKIFIAFLTLVLTASTFVTSTMAWVSLARVNQIEGIWLIATLGDTLEISLDGEHYYEELPKELIIEKFENATLMEVTSVDGMNFSYITEEYQVAPNKDYLSLEFYFRTTSKREREVYLANNISHEITFEEKRKEGTYVISKGVTYRSPIEYLYDIDDIVKEGEIRTYYASGAIRIATIQERIDEETVVKIFDLSGNEKRGYAKPYGAYDYYRRVTNSRIELPTEIPNTIYQLSEFDPLGPFAYDDRSHILTLDEEAVFDGETYFMGKMKMNIWLEGWDADSFDSVVRDRIKIQLQFKAVREIVNQ